MLLVITYHFWISMVLCSVNCYIFALKTIMHLLLLKTNGMKH